MGACVRVCVHMCAECVCVCVSVYMHAHGCVCACECVCVWVGACVRACLYVFMDKCPDLTVMDS